MLHKLLCLIRAALRITIRVVQDAGGEDVLEDVQATSKCIISDLDCHNVYNISITCILFYAKTNGCKYIKNGAIQDVYKLKTHKCKVTIYELLSFSNKKIAFGF